MNLSFWLAIALGLVLIALGSVTIYRSRDSFESKRQLRDQLRMARSSATAWREEAERQGSLAADALGLAGQLRSDANHERDRRVAAEADRDRAVESAMRPAYAVTVPSFGLPEHLRLVAVLLQRLGGSAEISKSELERLPRETQVKTFSQGLDLETWSVVIPEFVRIPE